MALYRSSLCCPWYGHKLWCCECASMASSSIPQKEQLFYLCPWEAICCCPELAVKHLVLLASRLEGFTYSHSWLSTSPVKGGHIFYSVPA